MNQHKKNKLMHKAIMAVIFSAFASLGTIPYGYHFADFLKGYSDIAFIFFGVIFATTAALANVGLGTYSFLSLDIKQKILPPASLVALSLVSAIPTGILSYFGYESTFPLLVNIAIMITVTLTNAGINYTAILNLSKEILLNSKHKEPRSKFFLRLIGLILGVIVSLCFYMATIHGLVSLFNLYIDKTIAFNLACLFGFIIWIPEAALFGNSTQVCMAQIYDSMKNLSKTFKSLTKTNIFIFIFSIFAASSYTQIAIVFFNPELEIPDFMKSADIQWLIYHGLVPITFFSAFSVNYFALISLLKLYLNPNQR